MKKIVLLVTSSMFLANATFAQLNEVASLNQSNEIVASYPKMTTGGFAFPSGEETIFVDVSEDLVVEISTTNESIPFANAMVGQTSQIDGVTYTPYSADSNDYVQVSGTTYSLGNLNGDIDRVYKIAGSSGFMSVIIITQGGNREYAYKSIFDGTEFSQAQTSVGFYVEHIDVHNGFLFLLKEGKIGKRDLSLSLSNLEESDFSELYAPSDDIRSYRFNENLLSFVHDDKEFVLIDLSNGDVLSEEGYSESTKLDVMALGKVNQGSFVVSTNFQGTNLIVRNHNSSGALTSTLSIPMGINTVRSVATHDWSGDGNDEILVATDLGYKVYSMNGDNLSLVDNDFSTEFTFDGNTISRKNDLYFNVQLIDHLGRIVYSENNLSNFLPRNLGLDGVYFIKLNTKGETLKIIL